MIKAKKPYSKELYGPMVGDGRAGFFAIVPWISICSFLGAATTCPGKEEHL